MAINPIRAVLFDMGGTLEDLTYDETIRQEATRSLREYLCGLALDPGLSLPDLRAAVYSGLAAYQARRRARAARVIAAATSNAWKYHLRAAPLRGAAHLALRMGWALAPGRMVRQFDWIYRHDVTA